MGIEMCTMCLLAELDIYSAVDPLDSELQMLGLSLPCC